MFFYGEWEFKGEVLNAQGQPILQREVFFVVLTQSLREELEHHENIRVLFAQS